METLYTQPGSLAIGAACGIITSITAAIAAQDPAITASSIILSLIAIIRVGLAVHLRRPSGRDARALELIYEFGAYSYSAMIGVIAMFTVRHHGAPMAMTLMVANAIGYAVGIAARNAGRPAIAIGQMILTLVPICVALLLRSEMPLKVLAFSIMLLLPAMMSITMNVFKVLRNSIASAETSQRLADKMQLLARTDVVTGLLNRAGLNYHLVDRLSHMGTERKLALFWLDLDRFKEVNDTLGHQIGDRVLVEMAARIKRRSPHGASLARFGGDEFIVAAEADSRAEVETMAKDLLEELNRTVRIDDDRLDVGCSIGVAVLPDDANDLDSVMQGADLALFQAKQQGRKRVAFFDPSMTRNLVRRKEIETELRLALQRDELSVFFQPIIDLETGRIRAFEALVRWFHPEKGELRPDEFIPVAEECGAIITLGNWITTQAARVAAQWPDDITLAVNLSPLQIRAPGAALGILNAIREARLPATRLELEITETVLLGDDDATRDTITVLKQEGFTIALDDFGTGFSSLSSLQRFAVDKIKIDRAFVRNLDGDDQDARTLVEAIIKLGAALGLGVIAEGVETVSQHQCLIESGCPYFQGYLLGMPEPAPVIEARYLGRKAKRVAAG